MALGLTVSALLVACGGSVGQPAARPNILLILADDLGMNDTSAFGHGNAPTPHLDALAAEGVRFRRHYAFSTCAPSRASLLTGLHPSRLGFRPRGRGISSEVLTLADVLRQEGYATHHVGKWHLGTDSEATPGRQGFDTWFGFLEARDLGRRGPTYHDPWLREGDGAPRRHDGHLTDLLTDRAVSIVRNAEAGSQPWFLSLWLLAPHWPIEPASRYAARHPDSPRGRYAALIEQLDDAVGRILDAVEESGQATSTLVVFVSDNGGTNREAPNNQPFAGRKNTHLEGGLRTPLILRWPGAHAPGASVDAPVMIYDLFPTLATAAGVTIDWTLDGRDLAPLLRGDPLAERTLFWEQYVPLPPDRPGASGRYSYSVLSADGRYRLVRSEEGQQLLDLERDATGGPGARIERPALVAELERQYEQWHNTARVPRIQVDRSGGWLRGDAFQRGTNFGGFSFAVELRPDVDSEPRTEMIARQEGAFELAHDPQRGLVLRLGEVELRGPVLPRGRCSSVVFASYFHRSLMDPADRYAVAEIFVDGYWVSSTRFDVGEPAPLSEGMALGHDGHGGARFQGEIGRVAVVNERVEREGARFTPSARDLVSDWCIDWETQ